MTAQQVVGSHAIEQAPHLGGYMIGGDRGSWAPEVWKELHIGALSVLDIGCGEGEAAAWFMRDGHGATTVLAIDGGERACRVAGERLCGCVRQHDYTQGPWLPAQPYDLGWSCEFVEHVEERYLPNVLETFRRCRALAMTHALPGQGGHHHVNCRTPDYWLGALAAVGMVHDAEESRRLRELLPAEHGWYVKQSLLIFRQGEP